MTAVTPTDSLLDDWAGEPNGPVALHLRQELLPVEVDGRVVYPPTYADIGYNIDQLENGTQVATIDSVGSQANRLEPIFKALPADRDSWLVPQIEIILREEPCGVCEGCESEKKGAKCANPHAVKRSILDLAHRGADAVVQSSPTLSKLIRPAFEALQRNGDAGPLCTLAPTSLLFGVWDSRGGTGEKRPRLVRAIIRAWDVEPLHAAAQFTSISKALSEGQRKEIDDESKKKGRTKPSVAGLADAPAIFRDVAKGVPQVRDGAPNPQARVLGGVVVNGTITRDVTVNLVALRGLRGGSDGETKALREYLLGLALTAATAEIDLFLREGCHLRYADDDVWHSVPRRGTPGQVDLASKEARAVVEGYAQKRAEYFRQKWAGTLDSWEHAFDIKEAKALLSKDVGAEGE